MYKGNSPLSFFFSNFLFLWPFCDFLERLMVKIFFELSFLFLMSSLLILLFFVYLILLITFLKQNEIYKEKLYQEWKHWKRWKFLWSLGQEKGNFGRVMGQFSDFLVSLMQPMCYLFYECDVHKNTYHIHKTDNTFVMPYQSWL